MCDEVVCENATLPPRSVRVYIHGLGRQTESNSIYPHFERVSPTTTNVLAGPPPQTAVFIPSRNTRTFREHPPPPTFLHY